MALATRGRIAFGDARPRGDAALGVGTAGRRHARGRDLGGLGLAAALVLAIGLVPQGTARADPLKPDRSWLPLGLTFSPYAERSPDRDRGDLRRIQYASANGGTPGIGPQLAQAEEIERGETVESRKRPDWDPLGVRLGSFLLLPAVTLQETFNDNIFADTSDRRADFITQVQPEVTLRSDWSRHDLAFTAGADVGFYADNSDENFEDYFVRSNGRLEIQRDTFATASAGFQNGHEDRGSPDDVRGNEPTEVDTVTAATGLSHSFGRFRIGADGDFRRIDYDDVNATVAGRQVVINNDDRDRNIYTTSVRAGYEIMPSYEAFVLGSGNWRHYDDAVDDAGFQRDSEGFSLAGGVRLDLGGVIFGNLFAGYTLQDFEDPAFDTVQGADFGADMTWTVTPLTTITANASRTIEDTTIVGASGLFRNAFGLSVDHELLRNLILGVDGRFSLDDYQDIEREDKNYSAGADARYLLNRNIYLSFAYTFRLRESDFSADFVENVALVSLRAQY